MKRREFLAYLASAGVGVAGGGWLGGRLLDLFDRGELPGVPGPCLEKFVATVCGQCSGGCGLRVRTVDGIPVGISPQGGHPVNDGGMCPAGHSGLQVLYDPDRVARPLRRDGERGAGQWREASWEEAFGALLSALRKAREGAGAPAVFIDGNPGSLSRRAIAELAGSLPASRYARAEPGESDSLESLFVSGDDRLGFRLHEAKFVLLFGADPLDSDGAVVWQTAQFGRLRGQENRQHWVVVDSRRTSTAFKADAYLRARPGSEPIVALAVAGVIVSENLAPEGLARLRKRPDFGDVLSGGFVERLLREFPPALAEDRSGIPAARIVKLAHRIAEHDNVVVLSGRQIAERPGGRDRAAAIHLLNVLLDKGRGTGGMVRVAAPPLPIGKGRAGKEDGGAAPLDGASIGRLASRVGGKIGPLVCWGANPLFDEPGGRGPSGLSDTVSEVFALTPTLDETAVAADWVLPVATWLESWDLFGADTPNLPFSFLQAARPVFADAGKSLPPSPLDLVVRLHRELGTIPEWLRDVADAQGAVRAALGAVHASGRGGTVALRAGSARGDSAGVAPLPASPDAFVRALVEGDALWVEDPAREGSAQSAAEIRFPDLDVLARADSPAAAGGEADRFPLELRVFETLTLLGGRGANQPMLMEMAGFRRYEAWDSWLEIHPDTARAHGFEDREEVRISSSRGTARIRLRTTEDVDPGVVAMARGLGHTAYGRYAKGRGVNVNRLLEPIFDEASGWPCRQATKVRIDALGGGKVS